MVLGWLRDISGLVQGGIRVGFSGWFKLGLVGLAWGWFRVGLVLPWGFRRDVPTVDEVE